MEILGQKYVGTIFFAQTRHIFEKDLYKIHFLLSLIFFACLDPIGLF